MFGRRRRSFLSLLLGSGSRKRSAPLFDLGSLFRHSDDRLTMKKRVESERPPPDPPRCNNF